MSLSAPYTLTASPRLDSAASALLYPKSGPAFDFARPVGEPALVGPDSVSWRIFKNPVSLFIGGVAAVILELAEPGVRTGVWEHSSFRRDPVTRLQRTGLAAMVTVYGAAGGAEAMIAGVVRAHERVQGRTPEGRAYRANDVDLLTWVQSTAGFGFVQAYDRYVQPLTHDDFDRFFAEGAPAARLYGALETPTSHAGMSGLFDAMRQRLEPHAIVFEFLQLMRTAPVGPTAARPMQRMLVRAAVDLVPTWLRRRLEIRPGLGLRPWERPMVRMAAQAADRIILPSSPPVQACLRLSLPADHLYRR